MLSFVARTCYKITAEFFIISSVNVILIFWKFVNLVEGLNWFAQGDKINAFALQKVKNFVRGTGFSLCTPCC
jgi:hypothetical protein